MIVSVDGGATKTLAIAFDEKKMKIVGVGLSGGSNFKNVGIEKAINNIEIAINNAIKESDSKKIRAMIFGIAGIGDAKGVSETVENAIKGLTKDIPYLLYNDGFLAYKLANLNHNGIVFAAGTGSVCWYKVKDELKRVGGWGWFAGDEASAFWISKRAFNYAVQSYDEIEEYTILVNEVERFFGLPFREAILKVHLEHPVTYVASFAPRVTECANKRDKICDRIFKEAANEINKYINALTNKYFRDNGDFRISLVGGVMRAGNVLIDKISIKNINVYYGYHVSIGGILHLLETFGENIDFSLRDQLIRELEENLKGKDQNLLKTLLFF